MTWSASEVITGAPPAADADPNSTPPAASRILKTPRRKNGSFPIKALLYAVGGTSIPVTPYVKEKTTGVWVPIAAAITVTTGTTSYTDVPPDAEMFFRNGSATGAVTSRGVGFL